MLNKITLNVKQKKNILKNHRQLCKINKENENLNHNIIT